MLNDQLTSLGACLADEIMSNTKIKHDVNKYPFRENVPVRTCSPSGMSSIVV
jgi:hypothetical protein